MGRRPDAPFVLLFQKQVKCSRKGTPNRRQGFNFVPAIPPPVCTDSRFAKPRKFPKGNGFILFASTKRTKSSRRAAALSTPGDGSNRRSIQFFYKMTGVLHVTGYVQTTISQKSTAMIWTAANSKRSRIGYGAVYELEADFFDNSRLWRTSKGKLWDCGNGWLWGSWQSFRFNS